MKVIPTEDPSEESFNPRGNVFRASFSSLTAWESGDVERFVNQYFKLKGFTTIQMADGKDKHAEFEKEINETKALPLIFSGLKLKHPQTEMKLTAKIYPWLDLVGVIDCFDEPNGYEFKTGTTSSEEYAGTHQVGVYALLLHLNKMACQKFTIYHSNQYNNKVDMSMVWVTEKLKEDALNWAITLSGDAFEYLEQNKLFERFGRSEKN